MARFKVGQRVRKVCTLPCLAPDDPIRVPVGTEGTIVAPPLSDGRCVVRYDGYVSSSTGIYAGCYGDPPEWLAPLTDPLAEQFLATVKSWGPLEKEHA